ncbi:ABC transporter substrate-binding protein [Methanothrix sp.]|uniref:ABC transporter substrate-binding protein n=1 Tax=Methanothrix sp. TaxID=90426 RepID=UPI00257CCF89|nr:ABC transporter substrate-binding protein [Methanothrix sp.]NPU88291.1 ABC transporter substrate-binding protein [Methanothrix sp.]
MRMVSYLIIVCLIGLTVFPASSAQSEQRVKIEDAIGRTVEVSENVDSIVSLNPDVTRILIALGAGDKLVGVEKTAMGCPVVNKVFPAIGDLSDVGSIAGGTLSLEKIATLNPDIVFISSLYPDTVSKIQQDLGIPCVCTRGSARNVDDYLKDIHVVGMAIGKKDEAEDLVGVIRDEMNRINETASTIPVDQRKRVLYIGPPFTKDFNRVIYNRHLCVYTAGGINVAFTSENVSGAVGPWRTVSLEQIVEWDPDIIFIHGLSLINPEDVITNTDWKNLKAVREGQVYKVFAVSTGYDPAMLVLATMQMAKIMYPEKFDFDFHEWAEQVCQEIYGDAGRGLPEYMESKYGISRV